VSALEAVRAAVEPERRLEILREKTIAALAGKAKEPVFIGLQRVVAAHGVSHRYPLDLIEGMAMDVRDRAYASLDDTLNYAYHVAGVVGLMMAQIMGVSDPATLERACDLGIAFQLTNIARDVLPDADAGRIYLPADWLAQEGVSVFEVREPRHRMSVFNVVARLLDVADGYYESAADGIGYLPFRAAWAVATARRVYWSIGGVIRERRTAAWDKRAQTTAAHHFSCLTFASFEAAALIALYRRCKPKARVGLWTPSHLWFEQGRL
jgi:phytoene synthase